MRVAAAVAVRERDNEGRDTNESAPVVVGVGLRVVGRAGVGVESMDTQAAARTYNILMAEGRKVVAVLLPTA